MPLDIGTIIAIANTDYRRLGNEQIVASPEMVLFTLNGTEENFNLYFEPLKRAYEDLTSVEKDEVKQKCSSPKRLAQIDPEFEA